VKPETVPRSCEASAESLLMALDAAFVESVVLELISFNMRMFSRIAAVAPVCSLAELEMFCTRLAI
jgi:hypothetical protein